MFQNCMYSSVGISILNLGFLLLKHPVYVCVRVVTCRLYTPLHYRTRGQGSWAALHMVEYTDGRSLYQAACDRAYHGVIAIGHW